MTVFTTRTSAFRSAVPLYQISVPEKGPAPYSRLVVKSLAQSMELPADQVSTLLEDYLTADSGEGLPPLPEFLAGNLPLLAGGAEGEASFLSVLFEDSPDLEEADEPEDAAEGADEPAGAMETDDAGDAEPAAPTDETMPEAARGEAGAEEADDVKAEATSTPPAEEDAEIVLEAEEIIEVDAGEVEEMETCLVETAEEYVVELAPVTDPWPWETSPDMTLQEALEALSDKELSNLTEEIVKNTIEEKLPEGAIKSLCQQYALDYQKVYSAIQRESKRRISRMNSKPRTPGQAPDATMELGMRMAKKFLMQDMRGKRTWFKSPWPNEDGNYYIFQSHKVDDEELPIDFPTERVYYREVGDGWAISVGY